MADYPPARWQPPAPDRLPTLTEVIEIGLPGGWVEAAPTAPVYGSAAPTAAAAPPQIVADYPPATWQRPAPDRLPTLNEVIEICLPGGWVEAAPTAPVYGSAAPTAAAALDEAELAQRVLRDVQQSLDALFEARLREALAPGAGARCRRADPRAAA